MNEFIFSRPVATKPAALSAALAGGSATKTKTLAGMIGDRIVASDMARLKTKSPPAGLGDPLAIVERFRRGGGK